MSANDSVCATSCEGGPTSYHNPTEEVTLHTVFRAIGQLEGKVDTLQSQYGTIERQMENIAAVAAQPKECKNELRIERAEKGIEGLQAMKNQAIGGKAMLVFLILLTVTITGTIAGVWMTYKTSQKVQAIEIRVNGDDHE